MKLFRSQFSRCPRSWDTRHSVSSHICQTMLVSNWFLQFPVPELYFWRANKNKDESPSPKSNDNSTHIYYIGLASSTAATPSNMSTSLSCQVLLRSYQKSRTFHRHFCPFNCKSTISCSRQQVLKITFPTLIFLLIHSTRSSNQGETSPD